MAYSHVLILAGGRGVRMKSEHPKVLAEANGRPLLLWLLDAVVRVCPRPTIVVGYRGDEIIAATENKYHYVWQREQLGTGHAVEAAKEELGRRDIKNLVVLLGDHPLVSAETIRRLAAVRERERATIAMGTVTVPNFDGDRAVYARFGRVLRDEHGDVRRVVEFKDATPEERAVREVNLSYYCFDPRWLWENVRALENDNAAGEYYLTDMVQLAFEEKRTVVAVDVDPMEGMGANTPEELAIVKKYLK